jgi:hypothetical protein
MEERSGIVWRMEWRRRYESIWSLIEKIKIVNIINGNELLQSIKPGHGPGNRTRNVNKLSDEACMILKELTNIDFKEIIRCMEKMFQVNFLRDPLHIYHTHLRYCRTCVQHNYHSYLHQYKLIETCPFHLEKFEECCEKCGKQIYFYNIAVAIPYTCRCGMQMYQSSGRPVWENWSVIDPVIQDKYIKDLLQFTINELSVSSTKGD